MRSIFLIKNILAIRREHRAHKDHSTSPAETTGCQVRFTLDRGRFFENFRLAEAEHIGFEVFGREHETVDFSETLLRRYFCNREQLFRSCYRRLIAVR
jgi:hypothetical protein